MTPSISGKWDEVQENVNVPERDLEDFLAAIREGHFDLSIPGVLSLTNPSFKRLPEELLRLENLGRLNIWGSEMDAFPMELKEMKSLHSLIISDSCLKSLPASLAVWDKLEYLNLTDCIRLEEVKGLPPHLTYLNFTNTRLREVPEYVYDLPKLLKLVLCDLGLAKIPNRLFRLKSLVSLFLNNSLLTEVPDEISDLTQLGELWLMKNAFVRFPEAITGLRNLEGLNLSVNRLSTIPGTIGHLTKLKSLHLGNNQFTSFPEAVFALKNLKELSFGNFVSPGNNSGTPCNNINFLPPEILRFRDMENLDLFDNTVVNVPAEIMDEGWDAIKNYFQATHDADSEAFLHEAKMVMVGRGKVGKTVLTKKLTDPMYRLVDNESTKGISVLKTPYFLDLHNSENTARFRFTIWDFGGQEKYDATHQLFITGRSVYLFLTEAREESNFFDFTYWLNSISLFSNNSPVIVVLSKCDERKKSLPASLYRERFENIVQFVDISCADGYEDTIEALKRSIAEAIGKLPQTSQRLPNHWVNIRYELENLAMERDHVSYDEYLKVCQQHKMDAEQADFLGQFLNDLGVIIYHQHDLLLKKTVFINPEWCTDALYKVLDSESVDSGKFTTADLEKIWSEERFRGKEPELLKLMCEYGLCFELKDGSGYLAPDLLPADRPDTISWDWADGLQFEIRYEFMPAGILSRFIVKCHAFIKNNFYWKYGVLLEYDNTLALVEEDYMHSKVRIALRGDNKKGLLAAIRMFFDEIHRDFNKSNKLQFEEMVPCNCESCRHSDMKHFYKFNVLRKYEQKARLSIDCEKSIESVSVAGLINDVQINAWQQDFASNAELRDFICYLLDDVLTKEIKHKDGYRVFWRDSACSEPKHETEFQPFIYTVLDNYCRVNGIHLARETKEANGSVDMEFSYTNRNRQLFKVCMEIKKAQHQDVTTAINTQLPPYMESMGTDAGIYLVVWQRHEHFRQPAAYPSEDHLFAELKKQNGRPDDITIRIINCCRPPGPSTR